MKEREEIVVFRLTEKQIVVGENLSHQKNLLLCQNVLYKGKLRLGVFFFLENTYIKISEIGKSFSFGFWGGFLHF